MDIISDVLRSKSNKFLKLSNNQELSDLLFEALKEDQKNLYNTMYALGVSKGMAVQYKALKDVYLNKQSLSDIKTFKDANINHWGFIDQNQKEVFRGMGKLIVDTNLTFMKNKSTMIKLRKEVYAFIRDYVVMGKDMIDNKQLNEGIKEIMNDYTLSDSLRSHGIKSDIDENGFYTLELYKVNGENGSLS